jgi:hypothetical protein
MSTVDELEYSCCCNGKSSHCRHFHNDLTCSFQVYLFLFLRSKLTKKEHIQKYLKPNPNNMWLKLALFSALFSIAASQRSPHREVGLHESSFKSFTTAQRQMADFSWDITPREGFPVIAFNDTTENSEVQFMYDYTGTLTVNKNISVLLYQYDCVTPADSSLVLYADYDTPGEISLDLDIIQDTIATSVVYNETDDATAATIEFCIRADYMFDSDSLNFYETVITINVDLTANFTLDAIQIERNGADDASSTLDCDVEIYYCYSNHTEVVPAPMFRQGSTLDVCIRVVEEDTSCCIKDIAEMDVDQDQDGDGDWDAHTDPITTMIADPLSSKLCSDDVCFVKTQLPSKFFSVRNPKNLTLSGVAILKLCDAGLGSPTDPAPSLAPTSQPTDGGIRALATATITATATSTDPDTLTNTTTTTTITQVTRATADITTKTTSTTLATTTSAIGNEPVETSNTSTAVEELPGFGALVPVAVATATAIEGTTPFVATATATATATAGFIKSATAFGTAISIVGPAATATSTATTTATRTTTDATSLATASDTTPLGTLPTGTDTQTGTDTVTAEALGISTATSTATSTFTEA